MRCGNIFAKEVIYMATQLEVIQKFMKALDTHTLTKKSNETDAAFATRILKQRKIFFNSARKLSAYAAAAEALH